MHKILRKQSIPQIWKCVSDYYYKDKSISVRQKAFQIMTSIHYGPNAEHVFDQFDVQDSQSRKIIMKYSPILLKTFEKQIKIDSMYQLKTFSFLNRLLAQNIESSFQTVMNCFKTLSLILPESMLTKELQFSRFDLESMNVIRGLADLYNFVSHFQFRQQIKKQIVKGLRYHEFYLNIAPKDMSKTIRIFDLSQAEDINMFILMLGQQIDSSKWKNVLELLNRVPEIRFYQSQIQKMIGNVLKLYLNCPYFLLQKVHAVILQLVLVDRKNMDIYIKVREKCLGSKNWMLRRNFIKMYAFFKMNASYQLNKSITPLVYKNIVNEKNVFIKMEFVEEFHNAYSYLDPNNSQEKIAIKEVISKFAQEKDKELVNLAQSTLEMMKQIDINYELSTQRILRNTELYNKETKLEQVQVQIKKHLKTEKLISKEVKQIRQKSKKESLNESKMAVILQKPSFIDKIKLLPQIKPLTRSNSTQYKKDLQKIAILNAAKKSRF